MATLVARGAPPEEVLAAVTEKVGGVIDVDLVSMDRSVPDGTVTVLPPAWPLSPPSGALAGGVGDDWGFAGLHLQTFGVLRS